MAFSPDSSKAYLGEPNAIAVYDTTTFQNTSTFSYAATFQALAASPDGSILYAHNGNAVFALDAVTGAQLKSIALPAPVQGNIALSSDGSTLFLAESKASAVDLVNTSTSQITVVPVPYQPTSVVVLP